jgi:hypothetical protein
VLIEDANAFVHFLISLMFDLLKFKATVDWIRIEFLFF